MDWDWELCESAENDDLEKVKKCLANGADINAKGEYSCTALDFAETDEIKAYLEQAIKQKEFIDFAKQGDIEKIRECLTNGVNINIVDSDGKTALIWACQRGIYPCV